MPTPVSPSGLSMPLDRQTVSWYELPREVRDNILDRFEDERKLVVAMQKPLGSSTVTYAHKLIAKYPQRLSVSRIFRKEAMEFAEVTELSTHPVPFDFSDSIGCIIRAAQPYFRTITKVTMRMDSNTFTKICAHYTPITVLDEDTAFAKKEGLERLPLLLDFIRSLPQLQSFEIHLPHKQDRSMRDVLLFAFGSAHPRLAADWLDGVPGPGRSVLKLVRR